MRATILTVGDEILIGQVVDTNATYMAAALNEEGIDVVEHLSVADSRMGIMGGLDRALQQSDLVLMTGGLGPTKDDITKLVLSDYFGVELRFHGPTYKRLEKIYQRLGRKPGPTHKEQCKLPTGAKVLVNERGTAPGLWLEKEDQIVVSMPGVPHEMMYLMENEVMRRLKNRAFDADRIRSVTLLTAGEGESTIAERLETFEDKLPAHMSLAYLPELGTVRLRLTVRGQDEALMQSQLDEYRNHLEGILGDLIFGYGKDDLATVTGRILQERKQTLVTAESCTGGAIGSLITTYPGSSRHYLGGVVAYSNQLKESLLGVPHTVLVEHGAVSEATVRSMAEGARERLGADFALATSGIAGPTGGTADKPVGTIWIALATPDGTRAKLLRSGKDRERNIRYTVLQALNLLRLELGPGESPVPVPVVVVTEAPAAVKAKPASKPAAKRKRPVEKEVEAPAKPAAKAKAKPKAASRSRKKPSPEPVPEPQPTAESDPATVAKPKAASRSRKKPVPDEVTTPAPKARGRKKTADETPAEPAKPAAKKPARGRRTVAPEAKAPAPEPESAEPAVAKPKRRPLRKK